MKFTPDSVRRVRDYFMSDEPVALKDFRMAAWAVAAWHCLGRYEEPAKEIFSNVKVLEGGSLELFVASGKSYARDDPRTGVVAPTGREDCPVDFLLSYMDHIRGLYPEEGDKFLFPTLSGKGLPLPKPMSYQSALKQMKKVVKDLDLPIEDGKRFGLHSARGGAATAASNAGVPLQAIQEVGRWTSESAPGAIFSPAKRSGASSLGISLIFQEPHKTNSLSLSV